MKKYWTTYFLFLICLLIIYLVLPDNNTKLTVIALLPVVFFLPRDIKRYRQKKKENNEVNSFFK